MVAVVTAVISPMVVQRAKNREAKDPTSGWQAAFSYMKTRIDDLDAEVERLRDEVRTLEGANHEMTRTIAAKDAIIERQSRAIQARDHRIAQLESAWPSGKTLPRPDPAFSALLEGG